ncbi:vitamin K-dependent protein S isoform X2 [Brachyhypopomus gauderio]|uniref:vitamin K-dependent protein S isoform X2 n=1 Tax=Brachyhypopomus gauderio TaxID=698409 RepID=UPI00404283EE
MPTNNKASQFLTRRPRANSGFEEHKKGNLERECIEELCSKEEAREIFENTPETEYFYPRYIDCLGSHRTGVPNSGAESGSLQDQRTCVLEITDQCRPLPCHKLGYERCVDGKGAYTCVCKPGWGGVHCEEDINECEDQEFLAGCSHRCVNVPGSFYCTCEDGYHLQEDIHCLDVNECRLYPSLCGEPSKCVNTPGKFECQCPPGYKYNFTSRECQDVDECERNVCDFDCTNTLGSYSCQCDGRVGLTLAADGHTCQDIPVCVPLYDHKHEEMLYLGEQFNGGPVIYLRFRLPSETTRFAAEFDFRTFDPEGVMLYAESPQGAWLMLGLRDGRIEVQFRTQSTAKVTSGGGAINDGQWHVISVEELENSISVKISKEAVLSISSPGSLFSTASGRLDTKVYIAGLPNRNSSLVKQINPRLDGCIRGWNLLNRGASGVKEVIQEKESKHCFVYVERGSFFTGAGLAHFSLDYSRDGQWTVDVEMSIRPSSSTGVLFALVSNHTVPLSLAVVTKGPNEAELLVFLDGIPVATLKSMMLCYPEHLVVGVRVTAESLQISANSSVVTYAEAERLGPALATLNTTMQQPVATYVGGLPDLPLSATPVSAYYHGCMEVRVNERLLDFDEAVSKHNSIKSHSCPPVHPPEPPTRRPDRAPAWV